MLNKLRNFFGYVISFILGRGALFGAPLLLANLLIKEDYGRLETAQAAASLWASAIALGTAGLVPLVLLGHTRAITFCGIVAHHLAVVIICAGIVFIGWFVGASPTWSLAAIFTAGVVLQSLASTHLKTLGRNEASVLLDAGLFSLMAIAALSAKYVGYGSVLNWVTTAAIIYALALAIFYFHFLVKKRLTGYELRWLKALSMGAPLMLGGIVSLLATTSGRLGMGLLAGPKMTADYAVLSRAAALPIIAHQLILIARFRNLFILPHAEVEKAAEQIVILVAASALGFWLFAPWLGIFLGSAFIKSWANYHLSGGWIAAQAVLWSAIALNDLVISRNQMMAKILPASIGFIVLALSLGWLVLCSTGTTLNNFVYVHAAIMLSFYVVQSVAMAAVGVSLWRTWRTAVVAYLFLLVLTTVWA